MKYPERARPAVTVLLPVYNGAETIAEAMESILAQTFTNFECLIIDDASTDNTLEIVEYYAQRDSRIRVLVNPINSQLASTLNRGLDAASAPLIARMDADDWAYPERLAIQYDYMQEHTQVALCSTGMEEYETGGVHAWGGIGEAVRARLLFNCCVFHPTVMARRDVMLNMGGYNVSFLRAQDYDFWVRIAGAGHVLACLPEVLLRYRMNPVGGRTQYKWETRDATERVHRCQLKALGLEPSRLEYERHLFFLSPCPETPAGLRAAQAWREKIYAANGQRKIYDPEVLGALLDEFCQSFRVASWRTDPGQYCRRLARNALYHSFALLNFDRHCEQKLINTFRAWGISSSKKA